MVYLKEVVEAHCVKCVVQKTRREVEAKAKEEAKRQRLVKKEEKRKKLKYVC